MGFLSIWPLACARERRAEVKLGEFGSLAINEKLRLREEETEVTGDWARFRFRRVNDTHLNGQTSYREFLEVRLVADDWDGGWPEWEVRREIYEQHPVRQPALRVKRWDAGKRVYMDWLGWEKDFDEAGAKAYLMEIEGRVKESGRKMELLKARRDWPETGWAENCAANLRELGVAYRRGLQRDGEWLMAVDDGRPRKFYLLLRLGALDRETHPVHFHGPVTGYLHVEGGWWQNNQGSGGGLLPRELVQELGGTLTDKGMRYYFAVQELNVWQKYEPGVTRVRLAEMKQRAEAMGREYRAGRLVEEVKAY
jgi:hypothetical protein